MSRVTPIFRPGDYPGDPDAATREQVTALFDRLFPGVAEPRIDQGHAGIAIAAHNPALAGRLADISAFMALDLPWSQRRDLRELAIQTVNLRLGCPYAFQARIHAAEAAGITGAMLDALAVWRASDLFDADQRLVIDYAEAVVANSVSDPLFARLTESFGEKGAVECTTVVAFWSFWALFLNATGAGA